MLIHATAVAIGERAVLIRGASGAGKSDLALRLLALPTGGIPALTIPPLGEISLIADDQVELEVHGGKVHAAPPAAIAGKLEVRGLGIIEVPAKHDVPIALVVDLAEASMIERMPEARTVDLRGIAVPAISLDAREGSAPLKILIALHHRIER